MAHAFLLGRLSKLELVKSATREQRVSNVLRRSYDYFVRYSSFRAKLLGNEVLWLDVSGPERAHRALIPKYYPRNVSTRRINEWTLNTTCSELWWLNIHFVLFSSQSDLSCEPVYDCVWLVTSSLPRFLSNGSVRLGPPLLGWILKLVGNWCWHGSIFTSGIAVMSFVALMHVAFVSRAVVWFLRPWILSLHRRSTRLDGFLFDLI